jgi:hypothetical protein
MSEKPQMPIDSVPRELVKDIVPGEKIWTLYYRYGAVPHLHKNFRYTGTMLEAINRSREHCIRMGYTFICVRPFLVDLEIQEAKRAENQD